jgi:MFS family permease
VEQLPSASNRAAAGTPVSRAAAVALAVLAVLILAGSLILYALTGQNLAENGGQAIVVFASCVTVGLVIGAIAGHHTRLDANGVPAFVDHPAGWFAAVSAVFIVLLVAYWLAFAVAQVMSWRRSSGARRQQLKWLMAGAVGLAAAELVIQPVSGLNPNLPAATQGVLNTAAALAIAALVACLGVAILRYRLYDIDQIISRTLAYAIVTGVLVGVYAGLAGLNPNLPAATQGVLNTAAALAIAALFNPVRRRVQRIVDRRFSRARYDADLTVAAFAARLKDAVDLDACRLTWPAWCSGRWSRSMSRCGRTTAAKAP